MRLSPWRDMACMGLIVTRPLLHLYVFVSLLFYPSRAFLVLFGAGQRPVGARRGFLTAARA